MQLKLEDEFRIDALGINGWSLLKAVGDLLGLCHQFPPVLPARGAIRRPGATLFSTRKLFLPERQFQVIKISGHRLCPEWFGLFFDLPVQFLRDFASFAVRIESCLDIFPVKRVSAFK
jgi:hypothetical protein